MTRKLALLLIFLVFGSRLPAAEGIYYERLSFGADQPISSSPSSMTGVTVAGGNWKDEVQSSDGSIRLESSAIGLNAASPIGYSESYEDAAGKAENLVLEGTRYRYQLNPDGTFTQNPPAEREDGTFSIQGDRYDEDKLNEALTQFRAALRINPLDPRAYRGVLRASREISIARMVLAYQAYMDAFRFRLLPGSELAFPIVDPGATGSALHRQREQFLIAQDHLREALDGFVSIARDPVEGTYLLPNAPFGIWNEGSVPEEASRFFENYVRALAITVEIEEQLQRFDYLQNYRDPLNGAGIETSGPGSPAAVLAAIEDFEKYLVLTGAFAHLESFGYAPISRCKSGLSVLETLAGEMRLGKISFAPAARSGSDPNSFFQTSFPPSYVPFLTINGQRTFENMLQLAQEALSDALLAEDAAKAASAEVLNNETQLQERIGDTLAEFNRQLIDLCGSYPGPESTPIPDVQGYLLPPDLRLEVTGRSGSGAVLAQYKRIEQAETRYELALQNLYGLLDRIEIIEQGAAEQAAITRNTGQSLARIYTNYGEEFALLDKAQADIQAQAERDAARRQAEAHKKSWLSAVGNVLKAAVLPIAGAVVTAATGGTGLGLVAALGEISTGGWIGVGAQAAVGIASEIENHSNFNKQGKAIMEVGEIRAKSIERQGEINAQRTRLRAAESADVAMINVRGQIQQIELTAQLEIRKLYVELESLKLSLLLAEQEIDSAQLELVNLFERVGYLLEEYQEAIRMLAELPLNRPDFRYVRDYRLQVADDTFRRAQMWTYLALKSAQYRFMTTGTFNRASELIETTLKCRNATELQDKVLNAANGLEDMGASFYLENGFPAEGETKRVVISLRDHIFQTNEVVRTTQGELDTGSTNFLMPVSQTYGVEPATASNAQWLEFLQKNITGAEVSRPVLRLSFSTSLDPRGTNPLHNALRDQLGHVILSGRSTSEKGVYVMIRGFGISNRAYSVLLVQEGTTYLTYRARNDSDEWLGTDFPVRIWNLPSRSISISPLLNLNPDSAFVGSQPPQSGFDERSPYSDQWTLIIDGSDIFGPNWRLLTDNLDDIKDIVIGLSIVGFDPQETTP